MRRRPSTSVLKQLGQKRCETTIRLTPFSRNGRSGPGAMCGSAPASADDAARAAARARLTRGFDIVVVVVVTLAAFKTGPLHRCCHDSSCRCHELQHRAVPLAPVRSGRPRRRACGIPESFEYFVTMLPRSPMTTPRLDGGGKSPPPPPLPQPVGPAPPPPGPTYPAAGRRRGWRPAGPP